MMRLHSRLFVRILSRSSDVYVLKVFTLAVAFATSILVVLFSIHEYGYDTHYKDPDRLFRILFRNTEMDYAGNRLSSSIPLDVLQGIGKKLSDCAIISRVKSLKDVSLMASGQSFYNQRIYAADTTIDKIFSFEVVHGNIESFMKTSGAVAMMSKSKASQYFGDKSAVGKAIRLITFGDTLTVAVTTVFNDFPSNSHESFDFFIRYDSSNITLLNFDPDQSSVYARFSPTIRCSSWTGMTNDSTECLLQPVKDIYFGPRVLHEEARHGDMYSMSILICIVSLIFVLALCSFVNLSTMTLPYRSREIAVKKLAGITQRQLLLQFVYESLTLTSISLLFGVMITVASSHYVSARLGINIVNLLTNANPILLGCIVMMVCLVAIAPVFAVVRFIRATPMRLLSTDTIAFPRFKRIISTVQFGVSIFLIVSSIVVRRQINYSLQKETGQNNDQIVYVACPQNIPDSAIYRMEVGWPEKNPKILDAMAISQLPGHLQSKEVGSDLFVLQVDPNFKDFFHLLMRDGRWFVPSDDASATVVNQMALKKMPVIDGNVVGVVQDFGNSFNKPEQPVKITLAQNSNYNWVCVRVLEVDIRSTIKWIEERMAEKRSYGNVYFLNSHFESWLRYQEQLNTLSGILSLISALLAGCAIYGLTISVVRDKLREIAVHQLFGAGPAGITRLLALGLLRQMLTAIIFFGPMTYIFLTELLKTFAYATRLSWVDPLYPVGYCLIVIVGLCVYQAFSLNRSNFALALKGRT
ncbi:MAG TPA: FtsX-like permease family protein [Chryseolinea sp.]|nr:FtsX-like permease family protein [Chryseolinea sp.]